MPNPLFSSLGLRKRTASDQLPTAQPKQAKCNQDHIILQNDIIDMSKEIQRMIQYTKTAGELYSRKRQLIYRCIYNRFSKIIDGRIQNLKSLQDDLDARIPTDGSSNRSELAVNIELRGSTISGSWFVDDFSVNRGRLRIFDKNRLKM